MSVNLTATEDMQIGSVLGLRKNNRVRKAVASSRFEKYIGVLLHDCKKGDVLLYNDKANTDDIVVVGSVPVRGLELDENIYFTGAKG